MDSAESFLVVRHDETSSALRGGASFSDRKIVRQLAERFLGKLNYDPAQHERVSLRKAARMLDLSIEVDDSAERRLSRDATTWKPKSAQLSFLDSSHAVISVNGIRRRFALAHEVAHKLATMEAPDLLDLRSERDIELIVNAIASRLLVPDSFLEGMLRGRCHLRFSVELLSDLCRRLDVSFSVLVNRLSEASRDGNLTPSNCAMTVALNVSARQRQHYAPRTVAVYTPPPWFIPGNKRLSSLGAAMLERTFVSAPPFRRCVVEDKLTFWNRSSRRSVTHKGLFEIIPYGLSANRSRVMVAVFDPPII